MTQQEKMLTDIMNLLIHEEEKTPKEAFQSLLEFIAYELELETPVPTPWVKIKTREKIRDLLDLNLLRENMWDWIGHIHQLFKLSNIHKKTIIISSEESNTYLSKIKVKKDRFPRIIDRQCGTGRMILNAYKRFNEDAIFYGVEEDLTAYRIALLNMKIYNIQAKILHCDAEKYDVREGSPNWVYSNEWMGVRESRLLTEEEFDEFQKTRKDFA